MVNCQNRVFVDEIYIYFQGAISIGPSTIFLGTLGMPPIEAGLRTPVAK
jgi:hypothetical protein